MGEGEGEEINTGEERGGSQEQSHALFAKTTEGWRVCAEDFRILIPPSLGQAEGEWQHYREETGADPSEGQLRCRREG